VLLQPAVTLPAQRNAQQHIYTLHIITYDILMRLPQLLFAQQAVDADISKLLSSLLLTTLADTSAA
jgi:hypothetical protein